MPSNTNENKKPNNITCWAFLCIYIRRLNVIVTYNLYGREVKLINIKRDKFNQLIMRYIDNVSGEVKTESIYNNTINQMNIHSIHFKGDRVRYCLTSNTNKMLNYKLFDSVFGSLDLNNVLRNIKLNSSRWDQLNKFEKLVHNIEGIKNVEKLVSDLQFTSISFELSKMSENIGVMINKTWDDVAYKGKLIHLLLKIGYLEYDRNKRIATSHNESKKFGRHHIFKKG